MPEGTESGLDKGLMAAVSNANAKTFCEIPTTIAATIMNDIALQARTSNNNLILTNSQFMANSAHTSNLMGKMIVEPDIAQAVALQKMSTGYDAQSQNHDLAKSMSQLTAAVAHGQNLTSALVANVGQLMKGLELTPPQRAQP